MKLGILREGKTPPDKRVPLTPQQCALLKKKYPHVGLIVQSSAHRCFTDQEYRELGIEVRNDVSDCDILLGVKEVPISELIAGKTYLFFSHTIKKQPQNQALLAQILRMGITLVDYELMRGQDGQRVIGFGYYAGLVGAYNGMRAYGLRSKRFELPPAHTLKGLQEIYALADVVRLSGTRWLLTGGGKVAKGAIEMLTGFGVRQIQLDEFLKRGNTSDAVFCQLRSEHLYAPLHGGTFDTQQFYANPQPYVSLFPRYTAQADVLVAAAYWDTRAPALFTQSHAQSSDFKIEVIADITCDIGGSIPTTVAATTIEEPFYDLDLSQWVRVPAFTGDLTVMAIDNLPSELPRNASEGFGQVMLDRIIPELLSPDSNLISRATIAKKGALTPEFEYLSDYAAGRV